MSDDDQFAALEGAILSLRRLAHAQLDTIMDLVSGVSVDEGDDGDDGEEATDEGERSVDDAVQSFVDDLLARTRPSAAA